MSGNTLKNDLKKVLEEATKSIKAVNNLDELESMRIKFLGKKSSLNSFMKSLSELNSEEKAIAGKSLNNVKNAINSILEERKALLSIFCCRIRTC